MLGIHDLWLFVFSGILLNMTPGPDVFYVVGRSASHGVRGGVLAALGVATGCFVHIAAAAVGLTALLAASATAFSVIKLAGAAYLVYAGLRMLLCSVKKSEAATDAPPKAHTASRSIFVQGFLTNALNPKVALFFLAFLPQFIDHDAPHKALAFALLGLIFNGTGTTWNLLLAWSTARVATGLGHGRGNRLGALFSRGAGALFVAFGVRLALTDA